ncbi:siroheme synthase CysG [Devosia sp. 66-22]|uniref:siroheme synthase CysG n=1 Tax=Devosia sp. 66-22 TaxID=1895753 RepID=UPI0009275406|nr:siroheme synthase CysG [Devosia sp. 66-22]OJX50795.1 MAG: uroporphyrinogen-III C-methyltransferase [Devosia sp. 66-22]
MGELNTFPVSYKVKGKRIVIVGGGEEALNKARLAIMTTASVVIISEAISSKELYEVGAEIVGRFETSVLDDTALVFVAETGILAEQVKAEARSRGIPVNVVDVPGECDFYTPSIIDRAPLTVAISTEGDAPVLARLVRAKIEALLSPDLGRVARLAGSLRERVADALGKVQAKRFYEDLVTGVGEPEVLLEAHAGEAAGEVWLIGAGPGAEDLLTLRAQRLLQAADVIVHDQLVPDAVIEMGRRDAERIPVGKKKGHHSFTQAQINTLLVRLAREGKRVARLKSGDPMVLGRAGEELAALRKAGIGYQIVPGISAAMAAAADTATPVTLRKVSPGVLFATAHGAQSEELDHWAALASSGVTLGLYMGKSIAAGTAGKLIGRGMNPSLPIGIVVNAGRRERSLYRGSLGDLATGDLAMEDGPAIIFVGEAVAHGDWAEAADLAERTYKVA